jgi:hypothetical protein
MYSPVGEVRAFYPETEQSPAKFIAKGKARLSAGLVFFDEA